MKKMFTQIGLIFILSLCIVSFAKGQISLTSTGGTSTSATYTTLKAAFDKINDGTTHTGAITILVTGNTTETASAVLGKTGVNISPFGIPNYTSVHISPAAASGGRTISGNINGPLIQLQGSDNVTIDGINDGSGASTRSLTISNSYVGVPPHSSYLATLSLAYNASFNTIKNCTILGSAPTSASGVVNFESNSASSTNVSITGCSIGPVAGNIPAISIRALGSNIVIDTCRLYDFAYISIDAGGCNNSTITRNRIYQTSSRATTASMTCISVGGGSAQITDNIISNITLTGSNTGFGGISFGLSNPATSVAVINISNNTISDISITSTHNSGG
jgi:trimeric autotransporter adhesin